MSDWQDECNNYQEWKRIEAQGPQVGQLWCYISNISTVVIRIIDDQLCDYICQSGDNGKTLHKNTPYVRWILIDNNMWSLFALAPAPCECGCGCGGRDCKGLILEEADDEFLSALEEDIEYLSKDIVNAIHNPDVPSTEDELARMWEVTRSLCK